MFEALGGIAGALGSIYGANVAASTQRDVNAQNVAMQEQINAQNIAEQEKFAQTGVQWRVADAKAAGINPLAALGASTQSFSNVVAPQVAAPDVRGITAAYSNAGQSLGRSIAAIQTDEQRAKSDAADALKLENASLQNDLLRSQITRIHTVGVPPPVQFEPDKVTSSAGPGQTAGVHPDVQLNQNPDGSISISPAKDQSVAMFNPESQRAWDYRNVYPPIVGLNRPDLGTKEGYYRLFNPFTHTYTSPMETPWNALQRMWHGDFRMYE